MLITIGNIQLSDDNIDDYLNISDGSDIMQYPLFTIVPTVIDQYDDYILGYGSSDGQSPRIIIWRLSKTAV